MVKNDEIENNNNDSVTNKTVENLSKFKKLKHFIKPFRSN